MRPIAGAGCVGTSIRIGGILASHLRGETGTFLRVFFASRYRRGGNNSRSLRNRKDVHLSYVPQASNVYLQSFTSSAQSKSVRVALRPPTRTTSVSPSQQSVRGEPSATIQTRRASLPADWRGKPGTGKRSTPRLQVPSSTARPQRGAKGQKA